VTTELGVELKSAKVMLELKTLFSSRSPVGAGIGSTTKVGAIPLAAAVLREVTDTDDVPTALVAVAVNV
jgi:hypothetical protein